MLYFLQNDTFKVAVESLGAELQHFIKTDENLELIWQADPAVWAAHAPNLFPVVGELPNQTYTFEEKEYRLPRHGFARQREFELVDSSKNKLVFQLKYDEETLAVYPFEFRFLIAYRLEENQLFVTYQLTNTDKQMLYFGLGAHPGFNVPLYPNEKYEDYYLEFEHGETLSRYLLNENGLLNGEAELLLDQTNILPLQHSYFDKDAIVFKNPKSEKVTLANRTNQRRIELAFEGFPYLGIWAKPGPSPYVCIEPWCGIASSVGDSGELQEKEGINALRPAETFERTFSITVY